MSCTATSRCCSQARTARRCSPILDHAAARRGRRPRAIAAALRVRTTPEQEAILRRWEDGDDPLDE